MDNYTRRYEVGDDLRGPTGVSSGTTPWNVFYDQVLRMELGPGVTVVAYADDLAVIVTGKTAATLEERATHSVNVIQRHLSDMGIRLASAKAEMVLLSGRRKFRELQVKLRNDIIRSAPALKYMEVFLDKDLRMTTHARKACEKASRTVLALTKITANMGGPTQEKRKVLVNAALSQLLYGAAIWAKTIDYKYYED